MENGKSVLVADDEPAVALAVKSVLKFCGYQVEMVSSGEEALARVRKEPKRFALVLTDHNMPGLSGLEVAQQLDAMDYRGKVMIVSAFVTLEMETAYRRAGVDRIVLKPFDIKSFREAVESTLHAHA